MKIVLTMFLLKIPEKIVTIIGSPIIEEKVDLNSVANFILENKLSEKLIYRNNFSTSLLIIYNINNNSLIVKMIDLTQYIFIGIRRWTVYWPLFIF